MLRIFTRPLLHPCAGVSQHFRSLSTALTSERKWTEAFTAATEELRSDISFKESADRLRALIKTDLLHSTDLKLRPNRFFEAHRILARHAVKHGPGFWIRFTVHYNLCMGTVLAVGSEEQVKLLDDYQDACELGCFSLTEKLAGVQSGLVVQTTCTYDRDRRVFVLNTPNEGARKNWISQGFTADKTVVLADLIVDGESKGPHAFMMDFRNNGDLVAGVTTEDMGKKTVGNDLDNAWISFDNVELPLSALLSRYAEISSDGKYSMKVDGVRPFDMIGQRLYTGRVAVAQAALAYRRQLFKQTKEYSDSKRTFSFSDKPVLSDIPQLATLYEENEKKMADLDKFVGDCERALSECLKVDDLPPVRLTDAIATCKVQCVEDSIDMCFRLKQEVGSFALMDDAGFKHMDFLQCCKFAEGDSRILMSKMARDRLKIFAKVGPDGDTEEVELCKALAAGLEKNMKVHGMSKQQAWDAEWRTVYKLADIVMARSMKEGL